MSDNTASGDPVDITTEGWPVLHIYYRLDRALWSSLDEKEQEDGIEEVDDEVGDRMRRRALAERAIGDGSMRPSSAPPAPRRPVPTP